MKKMRTRTWKGLVGRNVGKLTKYAERSCDGRVGMMLEIPKSILPVGTETLGEWDDMALIEMSTAGERKGDILVCEGFSPNGQPALTIPFSQIRETTLTWFEAAQK